MRGLIGDKMQNIYPLRVPLTVDVGVGLTGGTCRSDKP